MAFSFPRVFAPLTGNILLSYLDDNFDAINAQIGSAAFMAGPVTSLVGSADIQTLSNKTLIAPAVSGQMTITGNAARILADFSDSTPFNRTMFQTSIPNGATGVRAMPNGSSSNANFGVLNQTVFTSGSSLGILSITFGEVAVNSTTAGSGANAILLPLSLQVGSATALRIETNLNVGIGTAALATGATAGFLWVTSSAGAPTGAASAPYSGACALHYDSTNNQIYIRSGGTWRKTAALT